MSEYAEAQQATADGLAALGLQVTLMVQYPSKVHAPEGILLTTYDQLQPQITKRETTAYAFPSFGAAQTIMRSLEVTQQAVFFVYECHANTGPVEIAAKVFDTCHKHINSLKEIKQLTDPLKYQKYSTVLYLVKMEWSLERSTIIEWQLADTISDELLMPARLAFENIGGIELRQGRCPGTCETSTIPNGCYNSDKSKGSAPVTIKYHQAAGLAISNIRAEIDLLLRQSDASQDTQFQIKEGVDWKCMQRRKETANWTIMSTRHLNDQGRLHLAQELMSFRIKYYFLSKSQIIMQLGGVDIEVLRNLLHCSTTYLPFGQRQQSTQVSIGQVTPLGGSLCRMTLSYSPIGSFPSIPLQIAKSSILPLIGTESDIVSTDLGYALITTLAAMKFEFQVVVSDDQSNIPVLTFLVPNDIKQKFPSKFSVKTKDGVPTTFTIEHCGNILPQTGAPGEPPRHDLKSEHWRRVGEKSNPSFKNRMTVIAPASIQSAPQKRRFGFLKDAVVTFNGQHCSYTYAEETFPWILFLERPSESDVLHTFLTHFGDAESVQSGQGDYRKQSFLQSDSTSRSTRIIMLELPSGKKCQVNRIEGAEDVLYLTKVDALKIYSFKASYIVLLVPPFIDFRALLSLDSKAEILTVWKFFDFESTSAVKSQTEKQLDMPCTPQSEQHAITKKPISNASGNAGVDIGIIQPSPEPSLRAEAQKETPSTPLSQQVKPYQDPLPTLDHSNDSLPSSQPKNADMNVMENAHSQLTPQELPHQENEQCIPTVSLTAPWTQLPTSQPPLTKSNYEDGKSNTSFSIPAQLPQISTPPKKTTHTEDQFRSSQKECPKGTTTAGIGDGKDTEDAATTTLQISDPIHTPTSPLLANDPDQAILDNAGEDDPVEPISPDAPRSTDNLSNKPTAVNVPAQDRDQEKHGSIVLELANVTQDKPSHQTNAPMSSNSGKRNPRGSPIQDALKRASTLPANDETQILIDITGEDDNQGNNDTMTQSPEHETQTQPTQRQFSTLAPFLQVCRKWFHSLDPTIVDFIAAKAQDIAINYSHLASMNSALYLLSQGPWVPTHISVHVRQAALAAVGLGWSWCNQIPTAFPFTCYEACLSAATLDEIPSNSVMPYEAIYQFYATICANLCQPTRNFLFSKVEMRCHMCNKVSTSRVDTFLMTIGSNTDAASIGDLLVPCLHTQDTEENKACSCISIKRKHTVKNLAH